MSTKLKSAENQIKEYMGGTREEVGEESFDSMVALLTETKLNALEAAVEIATERANSEELKPYYERRIGAIAVKEALLTQIEELKKK